MKQSLLFSFVITLLVGCSTIDTGSVERHNNVDEYINNKSSSPDKISYTLFHDFETGEKFGWEPYPFQQDVGYDALYFTRQSPTFNDSKYALARPVKANHTVELYQGFSRRLNLWTTDDSRIQVAVFFQSDRNPEKLELSLGTFDGRRYIHTIDNPKANRWVELDIPAEAFELDGEALNPGVHIQVITMKATYPIVYYLFTYTMLIDDFQINGERQRRFVANDPGSTHLEEFEVSFLNRHFFHGEDISLNVSPERGATLNKVHGTLVDGDGQIVRDNIRFTRIGDEWVNESIHRVSESDASGKWEIQLQGEASNGSRVEWAFEFLVPGERLTEHPRLFFSRDELDERMASLENNPVAQQILENALSNTNFMDVDIDAINEGEDRTAEALTGGPFSGWRDNFNDWMLPMVRLGEVITQGSFRYTFTGDEAAADKAKEALLKLSSFEKWNNNWMLGNQFWTYYPVGYTLKTVAAGYDMLQDRLDEDEKALVRDAMIEKGLKMFHRDMVEMNRFPSNNTNHQAVLSSGHMYAAAVLYGEDPDNPYMEPFISGILAKAKTFIDRTYFEDGSYGEPYSYQAMASRSLFEMLAIIDRNFGIDWTTTTNVQHFWKYPLQATHSDGRSQRGFGDGSVSLNHLTHVHAQWLVHKIGNPYVYDVVKPYWEEGNGGYMGYLWFRDDIEPISREMLPSSRVFDQMEGMVMRSGWEDESTIIRIHVGPHSNHFHYNKGSFIMMTNGDNLLYDLGTTGGYYENLEFPVYNIQAISKNVMLVDNDPESQKPGHYDIGYAALQDWTRVKHGFAGEIADALESDLAVVYKGKLKDYNRTFLYTKSGPLFLFDEVRSVSSEGHMYNWLFHAEDNEGGRRSISFENNQVRIERPNARLTIDVVSDQIESGIIRDTGFNESFVSLNSVPGLTETHFLAVLTPQAASSSGQFGSRPVTERIEAGNWLGAKVTLNRKSDYGLFRTSGSGSSTVKGFTTDASRFTASFDTQENLVRYYFEGNSFGGYGQSLSSEVPVKAAVLHHDVGTDVEIEVSGSTRLNVTVNERPSRVTLNGSSVRYTYDNGRVSLQVPAGRHDIEVR